MVAKDQMILGNENKVWDIVEHHTDGASPFFEGSRDFEPELRVQALLCAPWAVAPSNVPMPSECECV